MNTSSKAIFAWLLLAITIFEFSLVHGNDKPVFEPWGPKSFTNINDLREYLKRMKNYYNVYGRPRYGKRSEDSGMFFDSPTFSGDSLPAKLSVMEKIFRAFEDE